MLAAAVGLAVLSALVPGMRRPGGGQAGRAARGRRRDPPPRGRRPGRAVAGPLRRRGRPDRRTAGSPSTWTGTTYFSETRGGPAKLAADLRSGEVDLALIPSRDWAATGDPGFAALQAPFLVASTDRHRHARPERRRRAPAEGHGGVRRRGRARARARESPGGCSPGSRSSTRRTCPGQRDPGQRQRPDDGAALGARRRPRAGHARRRGVGEALAAGTLDGVEMAPIYLGQNGYNLSRAVPHVVRADPQVRGARGLVALRGTACRPRDRDALSDGGRRDGRLGGRRAGPTTRRTELSVLCENGLVVVAPSASALDEWRRAAPRPEDAATRQLVGRRSRPYVLHAGPADRGVRPAPELLRWPRQPAQARALHRAAIRAPAGRPRAPTDGPTIPPGTYEETVTAEQFAAAGLSGQDLRSDVTFTWVLRPDGTFKETQEPDYPDQGPQSGRYVVDGDQLTMTYTSGRTAPCCHRSGRTGASTTAPSPSAEIVVQDDGARRRSTSSHGTRSAEPVRRRVGRAGRWRCHRGGRGPVARARDWRTGRWVRPSCSPALARRRGPADPVALLAAALWFLATLALTPDGWWHALDGPLALAYRGPVLHLLARPLATGRPAVAGAAWRRTACR